MLYSPIHPEPALSGAYAAPWRGESVRRMGTALLGAATLSVAFAAATLLPRPSPTPATSAPVLRLERPPHAPAVEDQRLLAIPVDTARAINARQPLVAGELATAQPLVLAGSPASRARAVDCLAAAGWYEAGDDAAGQRAVMQVVANRVRHPAFPATVCAVVFQGAQRSTGCQFTFACDGSLLSRTPPALAWARARALATAQLSGKVDGDVGYATHYHADYVVPYWAASLDKIAGVGPHLFYRWKGYWGTRASFTRRPDADEPVVSALARLSPAHGVLPDGVVVSPLPVDTVTASPLPPVLVVAGVREKSLRGAVVRSDRPNANQFFLQLDPATFPGNYATAAVALCKERPSCEVLGWRDGALMSQTLAMTEPQRAALSFYFVQSASGGDRALWNCQQMPRSNVAQCLPAAGTLPAA